MSTLKITLGDRTCPFSPWRPEQGTVFRGPYAFDLETTRITEDRPDLTPSAVLATACDGDRGVLIHRDQIGAFLDRHRKVPLVAHNAAFDLRVLRPLLPASFDLYGMVEAGRVWDTMILDRLLALATEGHARRSDSSLEDCSRRYLRVELPKNIVDAQGRDVRTGFGRFEGVGLGDMPEAYLRYAAADTLATILCFQALNVRIQEVLQGAEACWGYAGRDWHRDMVRLHGPLTHHVQLRAAILTDALSAGGVAIDRGRHAEALDSVRALKAEVGERLRRRGYLPGTAGSQKALQSLVAEVGRRHGIEDLPRTPSGQRFSTKEVDLAQLATKDPFFGDLATYRLADKLESTYLSRTSVARVFSKFGFLLETGRTSCSGQVNPQALPRGGAADSPARKIRRLFVPGQPGAVFIDCDYRQIELVAFALALGVQFGLDSALAQLVNDGVDVHRLIAANVLGKDPEEVTPLERGSAKPISFGRPVGMGPDRLQAIARAGYGVELGPEEVQARIDAYHRLCPELDHFLKDEVNAGLNVAHDLELTPEAYHAATGQPLRSAGQDVRQPQGWLGGMLLKVLRDDCPMTRYERLYTPAELAYFWEAAQALVDHLVEPGLRSQLLARKPSPKLRDAISDRFGRRSVFTATGRLRANATFCSARNTIFQGLAADGAIYGMWDVWRAGFRLVSFVHDQVVVEVPAGDDVPELVGQVEALLKAGMARVLPGMRVEVESVVTRSLDKSDLDPRFVPMEGMGAKQAG